MKLARSIVAGVITVLTLLTTCGTAVAQALTPVPGPLASAASLRIVVKPVAPFVMQDGNVWSGFSIDLWRLIALRRGWTYTFIGVDTVDQQINDVQSNAADAGIAAISVTSQRERSVDFSYPYFTSGLQVAVAVNQPSFVDSLLSFVSPDLLKLVAIGLGVLIVVAHGVWLLERHLDEDFPRAYLPGLGEALWWAAVTLTTVGYGDRTPKRRSARLIAFVWMFTGIFLLANFTAAITTRATVRELHGSIGGVADLPGKRIATVQGSTADQYLTAQGLGHRNVLRIEDAYPLLEQGDVQAILYDAPVLQRYSNTEGAGRIQVVGQVAHPEQYAIVLPTDSPYRRPIDQSLLELMDDGSYASLYARWFGSAPN